MQINYRKTGSPFLINGRLIQFKPDELKQLIVTKLEGLNNI